MNGSAASYLYDGLNPATIAGSLMLASGNLDEIYAQVSTSGTTSYLRDGLNSVVAATGLYYYRARYYSPQLSRFISEDPLGLAAGTNFYAYVNGNPIRA